MPENAVKVAENATPRDCIVMNTHMSFLWVVLQWLIGLMLPRSLWMPLKVVSW